MSRILLLILAVSSAPAWGAQFGIYQHGTVVRMRMGDCVAAPHSFLASFGAPAAGPMPLETCPEYTLVSEKVVYVIVGRSSSQLIPLADIIDFRIHNGELAVRVDDAKHETKFTIREMILRSEWDMVQKHVADQLNTPLQSVDSAMAMRLGR